MLNSHQPIFSILDKEEEEENTNSIKKYQIMPITEVVAGSTISNKSEANGVNWAEEMAKLHNSARPAEVELWLKSAGLKEGIVDLIINQIKKIVSPLQENPPPSRHTAENFYIGFSGGSMNQAYYKAIQLAGEKISDLIPDVVLSERPLLPAMIIRCAINENWAW